MKEFERQLVHGQLKHDRAGNVFQDIYTDEMEIAYRPNTWKKVMASVAGAVGVGYYYGASNNDLGVKALYASLATGVGINIGMFMNSSRLDSVAAAAMYFVIVNMSGYLNIADEDPSRMYEAAAIGLLGMAVDHMK